LDILELNYLVYKDYFINPLILNNLQSQTQTQS